MTVAGDKAKPFVVVSSIVFTAPTGIKSVMALPNKFQQENVNKVQNNTSRNVAQYAVTAWWDVCTFYTL